MRPFLPAAPAFLKRHWIAFSEEIAAPEAAEAPAHAWQCELATGALTWSNGVFELFGLPVGASIDRDQIVAMYDDASRAILEQVRADAIARGTSFTLEAQIRRADGEPRWMRITADVACGGDGRPLLLYGTKQDISDDVAAGHVPFLGPLMG